MKHSSYDKLGVIIPGYYTILLFSTPRHYAASLFNRCTRQPLPQMHGEPIPIVTWSPTMWAHPSSCHSTGPIRSRETWTETLTLYSLSQHTNKLVFLHGNCAKSPFMLARGVPSNTKKSVLDVWNACHCVPIRAEDKDKLTFIIPWRLQIPQGSKN